MCAQSIRWYNFAHCYVHLMIDSTADAWSQKILFWVVFFFFLSNLRESNVSILLTESPKGKIKKDH